MGMLESKIKKILLVATHDSYFKALVSVALYLDKCSIQYKFIARANIPQKFIQLHCDGVKVEIRNEKQLRQDIIDYNADITFLGAGGKDLVKIYNAINKDEFLSDKLLVTLFPGVLGLNSFDGFEHRTMSDVILLNNVFDYYNYLKYSYDFKTYSTKPFLMGFLFLKKVVRKSEDKIAFIDQNFPNMNIFQKIYIVDQLIKLAHAYPDKKILLKMRAKTGDSTVHISKYSYEKIVKRISQKVTIPANFAISYEPMESVLEHAYLVISISSAALVESVHNGVRTAVLTDFGMREDFSNSIYIGSNMFASFQELIEHRIPEFNKEWAEHYCLDGTENFPELIEFLTHSLNDKKSGAVSPEFLKTRKDIEGIVMRDLNIYNSFDYKIECWRHQLKKEPENLNLIKSVRRFILKIMVKLFRK